MTSLGVMAQVPSGSLGSLEGPAKATWQCTLLAEECRSWLASKKIFQG